jgi:hypothetical protein
MFLHETPERYWDYAVEYAVELINHTAVKRLQWRTPFERLQGDTPDISVFRFLFYEPIHYLDVKARFPQPNMLPGRFLGIARTTGDSFTFYILPGKQQGRNMVLTRSVIRKRNPMDPSQYAEYDYIAPIENEGDDITFPNVTSNPISDWNPQVPINTNARSRGDVELPFEPEHKSLTSLLSERIMEKEPEEIILEDGHKAMIQQVNNDTGETIVHLEDGSYRIMDTEDIYNHIVEDYRCEDIKELLTPKYSENTGKLYILV